MELERLRRKHGFTQADVGKSLGVQQSTVAMWENGQNMPRADKLPLLAKLYGCSIDDLFKTSEQKG